MHLTAVESTDALCDWAESPRANYDGVAITPYQFVQCPFCHEPAIIVHTHMGGYPEHNGWRCMSCRDHQGPLVPWLPRGVYVAGLYVHNGWAYEIVPLVLEGVAA